MSKFSNASALFESDHHTWGNAGDMPVEPGSWIGVINGRHRA